MSFSGSLNGRRKASAVRNGRPQAGIKFRLTDALGRLCRRQVPLFFGNDLGRCRISLVGRSHDLHAVFVKNIEQILVLVKIIAHHQVGNKAEYRALSAVDRFRLMGHNHKQQRQRYRHRQAVEKTGTKGP